MSIKTKMVLMVVAILALVAVAIIFFTKRDVEQAISESEHRAAGNVLKLVELNIQGRYKSLIQDRLASIASLKKELSGRTSIVVDGLDGYGALAKSGRLTKAQARERALAWMDGLSASEQFYFLAFDGKGIALAGPDSKLKGRNLSMFTDVKGRVVAEAMYKNSKRYGSATAAYYWKRLGSGGQVKRFGLFTYYKPLDIVLCASTDIEAMEASERGKVDKIVEVLKGSIPQINIGKSGYVFLFTGNGQALVHPNPPLTGTLAEVINARTDTPLVEELREAASKEGDQSVIFTPVKAGGKARTQEVLVTYFKALDWYIAATAYIDELQAPAKTLITRQTVAILLALVFGIALAMALVGRISKPLTELTIYAKKLPAQDFTAEDAGGSALTELKVGRHDEVGRLAESFRFMEESLRENIKNLIETTRAKERIEGELSVAHDIQMGLLPKIFPPFPERDEIDLFALLEPAKEVGGDLFDFFFLDDDRILFTVGDVSDKGVPASLFMAVTMTLIKSAAQRDLPPDEIMCRVNDALASENPKGMFVTLFVAVLDLRTGDIAYANGGHNLSVIMTPSGATYLQGLSGPMAGAMEDMLYKPLTTRLAPGETIFVYSDGVTEAMNEAKDLYSDERLLETMAKLRDRDPRGVVGGVMEDVAVHVDGAPASDDITMLCIRYNGPVKS